MFTKNRCRTTLSTIVETVGSKTAKHPTSKQVHCDFMKPARQRHAQRGLVLRVLEVQVGPTPMSPFLGAAFPEFFNDCSDDVNAPVGDRQVQGGVAPLDALL